MLLKSQKNVKNTITNNTILYLTLVHSYVRINNKFDKSNTSLYYIIYMYSLNLHLCLCVVPIWFVKNRLCFL